MSQQDKMTFFLLKWVFNAIKRDSTPDDTVFKGQSYISRSDLTKQLSQNPEVLMALGFNDQRQLADKIKVFKTQNDGYYTWIEFLEFFLCKDSKGLDRGDGSEWWYQVDKDGSLVVKAAESSADVEADFTNNTMQNLNETGANLSFTKNQMDRKPVKMTGSL